MTEEKVKIANNLIKRIELLSAQLKVWQKITRFDTIILKDDDFICHACEICCLDFNLIKETVINDLTLKLNTAKAEFDKL